MVAKRKKSVNPKKIAIDAPASSPMNKFHMAMKKIVSVPKPKIKDK